MFRLRTQTFFYSLFIVKCQIVTIATLHKLQQTNTNGPHVASYSVGGNQKNSPHKNNNDNNEKPTFVNWNNRI